MRSTSGPSQPRPRRPGNESAVFRADVLRIPMALGSSEGLRLRRLGWSSSPKQHPSVDPEAGAHRGRSTGLGCGPLLRVRILALSP